MNKVWIAMVLSSVASLSHATQQAFLIQNSGWMEPFYQDQNSQFKPLINGVIQTVAKPDDKIVVSVFNQSNALAKSPKIIYQGAGAKPMLADLQAQQIAYKNDKAYADTVERLLGEERPFRFIEEEKKGFLKRLFGG